MLGKDNSEKIRNLYNKLVNSMSNIAELVFTNKYISFNLYKAHSEILSLDVKNNILFKFSLLIFKELFEDKQNFKQFNYEKERTINSLLDVINEKLTENQLNSMISAIIFVNQNNFESLGDFKLTLINKLHIKLEFVYLILCYLNVKGFNLINLNEILVPVLRNVFYDSIINFDDALKSGIDLDKFLENFVNIWKEDRDFNYINIQWNSKKNDFSFSSRTVEEITQIIESESKKKKRYKNRKKNIQKTQINLNNENKMKEKNKIKIEEEKVENLKPGGNKDNNESKVAISDSSVKSKENLKREKDWQKQMEDMEKKFDKKFREYENKLNKMNVYEK